ncbi:Fimbrial chaperone protein [Sodalis praecaptivus]|uniref:Fimbrial chaperone protein n=1 Tax=Sodalis praecaptivus TaxID=1239307 RepID=W0HP02_9GAMM|nr:molecular chaperone [Sodalis praecaptivus]AHF75586.1 Fimbrial chaperone protein [Sodalis praecaptivus]
MSILFRRLGGVILPVMLLASPLFSAKAALILDGTRLIFPAGEQSASIVVENPTDDDYLMQSWLENSAGQPQENLMVEPPVAQIKAHHKVTLRVNVVDPQVRQGSSEKLFWLNVKEIPKVDTNAASSDLLLAMQTRIKLFFRPQGVAADRGDAWKKLEWFYQSGKLTVKNPTPYFITVNKALADGQQALTIDMVAPYTSEALPRKNQNVARVGKVIYDTLTDFGDISEKVSSAVR